MTAVKRNGQRTERTPFQVGPHFQIRKDKRNGKYTNEHETLINKSINQSINPIRDQYYFLFLFCLYRACFILFIYLFYFEQYLFRGAQFSEAGLNGARMKRKKKQQKDNK